MTRKVNACTSEPRSLFSLVCAVLAMFCTALVSAQEPGIGEWRTINSEFGESRHEGASAQAGEAFYVMGGRESDAVRIYDPFDGSDGSWASGATSPIQLHHFQAVELDGLIYAIGAMTGPYPGEDPVENVYIYDPLADGWIIGPALPPGRLRGSSGTVVHDGLIYWISGNTNGHLGPVTAMVDVYDPAAGSFTPLAEIPHPRDHFFATLHQGSIYVIGGRRTGEISAYEPTIPEIDVYDIAANTWQTLPADANLNPPRAAAATDLLGDEIIIAGGESGSQDMAHAEVQAFNPATGQWRNLVDMLTPRHAAQAIVSNDGFYVAAGSPYRGGPGGAILETEALFLNGETNPTGVPISAGTISAPASVVFNSASELVSLSHAEGNQAVVIEDIRISGSAAFSLADPLSGPITLAPGSKREIVVNYTGDVGTENATLEVIDSNSQITTVALEAAPSEAQLNADPPALAFPSTPVGDTATQTVVLSHTGEAALEISHANLTGDSVFVSDLALPLSLEPGATQSFSVNFTPNVATVFDAVLSLSHDGGNSPLQVAMTGEGAESGPLPVQLELHINADPGPAIAGDTFAYTMTLNNPTETQAENVVLALTLPPGTALLKIDGCQQDPAGHPACTIGQIPAHGSSEVIASVDVSSSTTGSLQLGASASADNQDEAVTAEITTPVAIVTDLALIMTGDAVPVDAETMALMYEIMVTNVGPSDAASAQVTTELAAGLDHVEWTCQADSTAACTGSGVGEIDDLANLPAGASVTYRIEATALSALVEEGVSIACQVAQSAGATDPNLENNSGTFTIGAVIFRDGFESTDE